MRKAPICSGRTATDDETVWLECEALGSSRTGLKKRLNRARNSSVPVDVDRLFVVDASADGAVAQRLAALHPKVTRFLRCEEAATQALASPPCVLVAPALTEGVGGTQICRLLGAEASTASTPVVLYGDRDDRTMRFWARRSGARAYAFAPREGELEQAVREALLAPRDDSDFFVQLNDGEGIVATRLAAQLEMTLFETTVASEVRLLAGATSLDGAFASLVSFIDHVCDLPYVAVSLKDPSWTRSRGEAAANVSTYRLELLVGNERVGELVCGARGRLDADAERIVTRVASTIARELGVPLRTVALVEYRARLERQLRHTQKLEAMRLLTAKLAHEINTPLQYATTDASFLHDTAHELTSVLGRYRAAVGGHPIDGDEDVDFLLENLPAAARETRGALEQIAGVVRTLQALVREEAESAHPPDDEDGEEGAMLGETCSRAATARCSSS